MILFTTSRKPSKNIRTLAKKIANLIPNSIYLIRGKKSIEELLEISKNKGYPKICIITNKQGNPYLMRFINLGKKNWDWAEELKIKGVYLSKEKITTNTIKTSKELEKLFNTKSEEEAKINLEKQNNQLLFKKGKKIIIKINLQE